MASNLYDATSSSEDILMLKLIVRTIYILIPYLLSYLSYNNPLNTCQNLHFKSFQIIEIK